MKYILLAYCAESVWDQADRQACLEESIALCHELAQDGVYVDASPLLPVETAHSVRVRERQALITDGPFAETKEQLGGYFLVDVANESEALAIAARVPAARFGTIEVRPLEALDKLPGTSS